MRRALARATAASANGLLIVCGGWAGQQALNMVDSFNPSTGVWSLMEPLQRARAGSTASGVGSKIFVTGGWDGQEVIGSVECFDFHIGYWEDVQPLTVARRGALTFMAPAGLSAVG